MAIQLLTLDNLRGSALTDRARFERDYPGSFLLAMGLVAVEAIRAHRTGREVWHADPLQATAAVSFGPQLRHQLSGDYPLAGCAFFLPLDQIGACYVIGRGANADITVPEPTVSERHCRLELLPSGKISARDLSSTNGTSINLVTIGPEQPVRLDNEDILSVGRYSFQLLDAATMFEALLLLSAVDA